MPIVSSTSLTAILSVVNGQLNTITGLTPRLVGRARSQKLRGDRDILVRPGDPHIDTGFDGGSGRVCLIIHRPLLVTVRTRLNLDPSDEDTARLTDPALGHIPLEESVMNALADFVPTDSGQNMLVVEPMHPLDYPAEEGQAGHEVDWIETRLAFLLSYQLPLSQSPANG